MSFPCVCLLLGLLRQVMIVYHRRRQQSLHLPQILVVWICWWTVEEKRILNYFHWQAFSIVPSSKRAPTPRMEKCPGYASGVVKHSPRDINQGWFGICKKLSWVILPFALPWFPRSTRINTIHCVSEARNDWHQRSAPILKLMMFWWWNRH